MALTIPDVRELFVQLWPPGRLYDWFNPLSNIARFVDGCAEALKTLGYDMVDLLRQEISPSRAVYSIPDWEQALGLTSSHAALNGTTDQRRAGIISKLREFGAFTLPNAQSILASLLGYADPSKLVMLEVDRAAMRAAHTYTNAQALSLGFFLLSSVTVYDGGTLSNAGVQLALNLPTPPTAAAPLTITLIAPNHSRVTWTTTQLGPPATQYLLYDHTLVGIPCNGTWTLLIVASAITGTTALSSWSLFVEGAGPSGLGGDMVDWAAYADPAQIGSNGVPPDFPGTRAAITRIEHAHTQGALLLSLTAIPDVSTTLPDSVIPA